MEMYPWHTNDDRLKQFLGLSFMSFLNYCQAVLKGSHLQGANKVTYEGC